MPLDKMIRTTITAAALAIGALAAPAHAEIVKAWCDVTWTDGSRSAEQGDCDFRQAFGNVQVWMGDRWEFDFRADQQGKGYERQNTEDFIRFKRGGYILSVFQGGKPESQPGGW